MCFHCPRLPAQLRETRALLTLGELMPQAEREELQHSLLRYDEATAAMRRIYRRANERQDHKLEGVERDVVGWRIGDGHPFNWTRQLPAEVQALSRVPGFEVRTRKPSPLELKNRFKEGQAFLQIPDWAWPLFFDHTQKAKKIEGLEFSFTHAGKDFFFWPDDTDPGALTLARDMERRGEKLLGYYNDRLPDRLYLTRQDGSYFATWNRIQRASRADREAHAALRDRVERRAAFARRGAQRRSGEEQAQQLTRSFSNGEVLERAGLVPPPDGSQMPGAELAKVVAADRQEQRRAEAAQTRQNRRRILPTEAFSPDETPAPDHAIPAEETLVAVNDEGFMAEVASNQNDRPTRRRILDASDFC